MNRRQYLACQLAVTVVPVFGQAAPEEASAARTAATDWIQKVDSANYAGSWEAAASMFKAAISVQGWEKAVKRYPSGQLILNPGPEA